MNGLVIVVIHLAQKSKHLIKMFARHQIPFLSQSIRGHFHEVQACVLWDVTNYNPIGDILLGDNVDNHSKSLDIKW